ncbi:MAG: AAA family ATPase [Lachnospiraceae bacterium]
MDLYKVFGYTSEDFDDSMTDKDMYNGIRAQISDDGRYYLLLDEIQEIDGWEKAVNSLHQWCENHAFGGFSNAR